MRNPLYPALAAARVGDRNALDRLMKVARDLLLALISPRMRGGWTEGWIEDVVQEALLDIVRGYTGCRARTEAEARAWVATIARREVAMLYRREARRAQSYGHLSAAENFPDTSIDRPTPRVAQSLNSVRDATERLTDAQHHLLWTRLPTAQPWTEVGRELGITPSAAKRRYQRILGRLQTHCRPPPSVAHTPQWKSP